MNELNNIGKIQFTKSGDSYVKIEEHEIFVHRKNTLNALNDDIVKISTFKRNGRFEGKVEEVIERNQTDFIGRVHRNKNITFVIPNRKSHVDFLIPEEYTKNAKNNQIVIVKFKKWKPGTSSPYGQIIKILGESGDNNTEMNSIMYEYNLPIDFPPQVEEEANNISTEITDEEVSNRRDMRDILTFTIDPKDAKDFDDALSFKRLSYNTFEIGIHIADVSHYIKPGSELEKEAINRSTSVYLVDRCIPMLPHRLSNGLCSLRPNEDKLTYSVVLTMNNNGRILNKWFGRTVTHSDHRFTYEQAQSIIEFTKTHGNGNERLDLITELLEESGLTERPKNLQDNLIEAVIILDLIAKELRKERNSIDINSSEVRFNLDDKGKPTDVYFKQQKDSNKLIEEFMLLANKEVSKLLSNTGYPSIYRNHDTPSEEKIMSVKNVSMNFGYDIDVTKENIKQSLNKLMQDIIGKPEETMISTLVTRSMSKAYYDYKNIGHYGLEFDFYSHFTSPIRRFADVILHRVLTRYLEKTNISYEITEMDKLCNHINKMENLSAKAQRDSIKYKQTEFLQDKIGQEFAGIISGVTDWGIYVELLDNKCEGMIRVSDLENALGEDTYIDSENYMVIDGKYELKLGDVVMVRVANVDLDRKTIDFQLC